jgi:hypothetical protein
VEDRLHALGSAVLAWCGCTANKAAAMEASAWAAWVQAVFSVVAIGAGFLTMYLQNRHADAIREAERKRGAEVVVFRVSGWLAEALSHLAFLLLITYVTAGLGFNRFNGLGVW